MHTSTYMCIEIMKLYIHITSRLCAYAHLDGVGRGEWGAARFLHYIYAHSRRDCMQYSCTRIDAHLVEICARSCESRRDVIMMCESRRDLWRVSRRDLMCESRRDLMTYISSRFLMSLATLVYYKISSRFRQVLVEILCRGPDSFSRGLDVFAEFWYNAG